MVECEAPPRARRSSGILTAIVSGKGGVGKTWFAITLADALARAGRRVLLFDGDLGLANIDIQLGLTPMRDLGSVLAGKATFDQALVSSPDGRFHILAGRSGSGALSALEPARLEQVMATVTIAKDRYDDILLDLGAGLDRATRRMAAMADRVVVLATEEPTSLTDAYAVLKLHAGDSPAGVACIVVNQAASRAGGERTYAALRHACATFLGKTPRLVGIVRRDERVPAAIRQQMLLLTRSPGCPAADDVEAIARSLLASDRQPTRAPLARPV